MIALNGDENDKSSVQDKCVQVERAVNGRRAISVTDALKKFGVSSGVYYR